MFPRPGGALRRRNPGSRELAPPELTIVIVFVIEKQVRSTPDRQRPRWPTLQ